MKEIKAGEEWLKRTDGLGHVKLLDAAASKDTCLDALRVIIISEIFFSLPVDVTHEKKMSQERAMYKGIEATFVKPGIPHGFGNCVSS